MQIHCTHCHWCHDVIAEEKCRKGMWQRSDFKTQIEVEEQIMGTSYCALYAPKGSIPNVHISQYGDGFSVQVATCKPIMFNQEDTVERLVEIFKQLNVDQVEYEEVY